VYRDRLSLAVLELLDRGEIDRLAEKWFYTASHPAVDCDHSANTTAAERHLLPPPSRYRRHLVPFARTHAALRVAARR